MQSLKNKQLGNPDCGMKRWKLYFVEGSALVNQFSTSNPFTAPMVVKREMT